MLEHPGRCQEMVYSGGSFRGHRCTRNVWKGLFCKIHHPDTVAARHKKSSERYEAQWAVRKAKMEEPFIRIKELQDKVDELTSELKAATSLNGKWMDQAGMEAGAVARLTEEVNRVAARNVMVLEENSKLREAIAGFEVRLRDACGPSYDERHFHPAANEDVGELGCSACQIRRDMLAVLCEVTGR